MSEVQIETLGRFGNQPTVNQNLVQMTPADFWSKEPCHIEWPELVLVKNLCSSLQERLLKFELQFKKSDKLKTWKIIGYGIHLITSLIYLIFL